MIERSIANRTFEVTDLVYRGRQICGEGSRSGDGRVYGDPCGWESLTRLLRCNSQLDTRKKRI